jgi:hypothetical protein
MLLPNRLDHLQLENIFILNCEKNTLAYFC